MGSGTDLTGQFLISMPGMGDPRFQNAVVLLTAHSGDGAMGLIVNKPIPQLRLFDLTEQMSLATTRRGRNLPVCFGGPVERERGFILHSADVMPAAGAMAVLPGVVMSATQDVLHALADGRGPQSALVMLGYAGWGPGQLEGEIAANVWLTAQATPGLILSQDFDHKWQDSLATLGISPLTLSGEAGHA